MILVAMILYVAYLFLLVIVLHVLVRWMERKTKDIKHTEGE